MLFEQLALSKDTKTVMQMAKKGQIIEKLENAIKDRYVMEFLNFKEETTYTESQVEQAIIDKIITNRHYYVDLVFYNRTLKCFVLINLKTGEIDHSDVGQINFHINYFKENERMNDENESIGLILCVDKDEIFAKYVLGGLNSKVFTSNYKLTLPLEKDLMIKLKSIQK
ncbi:MAG: PDDEXK nuclease domain-containing protein [Candidatus Altarchaeum sp.]|nr:PDDEXK nuclease domain-containing protein [Candidatus Altarchaeum sp.]